MDARQIRRNKICMAMILQIYSNERDIQNVMMIAQTMTSLPVLMWGTRRDKVPRVYGFAENTVLQYDDLDFKFHFRLQRSTVEVLLNELGNSSIPTPDTCFGGTRALTLKKQLLMFLWFAGNMESFRTMSDRFGVSQSTYHSVCSRVAEAITTDIMPNVISWPNTDASRESIAEGFQRIGRLPNTLGAIDGTHIRITAPNDHPQSYFNRKHFYSIQLQCVCTGDLLFTHAITGWPGSVHDARVFRNCPLADGNKYPPGYQLVGDSAYPLLRFLITPFRDNGNLGNAQRQFNRELSRQRNVIERAFSHLKGRFLRLQFFRAEDKRFLCKVVLAACTLHNICLMNDDELMEEFLENQGREDNFPYNDDTTGQERREQLMRLLN